MANVISGPTTASNSSILVTITCPTNEAEIRYTTDGSEPSETSALYEGIPVLVQSTVILTAKAFKDNWAPSKQTSSTYTINSVTQFYRPVVKDDQSPNRLQTAQNLRQELSVQYNGATLWLGRGNSGRFTDLWLYFPNILGSDEGQIPLDAKIISAKMVLTVKEAKGNQPQGLKLYQITDPDAKGAPYFGRNGVRNGLNFQFRDHRPGRNTPWQDGAEDILDLFAGVEPVDTYEFIPVVFVTEGYSRLNTMLIS